MKRGPSLTSGGGRFATFVNDDGHPPCVPPHDCDVCRLFSQQRPDETRAEWIARAIFPPYRRNS